MEQKVADEDDHSYAEILGVCHRAGCAVPDTGSAKTLMVQSAPKRHVEEKSHVGFRTSAQFRGLNDCTQHSQGAVELEWELGEKTIHFVAHVVPRNSGLPT